MRVCSMCGLTAEDAGPLCLMPCPFDKERPWAECKRCVLENVILQNCIQAIREDAEEWTAHLAQCEFCYGWKALIPKGALFQWCVERRRKEVRRVA